MKGFTTARQVGGRDLLATRVSVRRAPRHIEPSLVDEADDERDGIDTSFDVVRMFGDELGNDDRAERFWNRL